MAPAPGEVAHAVLIVFPKQGRTLQVPPDGSDLQLLPSARRGTHAQSAMDRQRARSGGNLAVGDLLCLGTLDDR